MTNSHQTEAPWSIEVPCIPVHQPLGTFFVVSIPAQLLVQITSADVRRMVGERPFETYLGIQRPLNQKRVAEIGTYVNTEDACFPTAVILAIEGRCAEFNPASNTLTLKNYIPTTETPDDRPIFKIQIGRVLDGQHRIDGLKHYKGETFEVNVSVFVDADIEDQAYLFSTVNLTQTKVNKSLVYDLFDLAKTRSPQKTCHNIAVALDKGENSPFYNRIKRLGHATPGRAGETLTQATVVEAMLNYISKDMVSDRDLYLKGKIPEKIYGEIEQELIFRNMFIDEQDLLILDVIWNYFAAIEEKWPTAWNAEGTGIVLNKTNGYRALMRLLRPIYLFLTKPGKAPTSEEFLSVLNRTSYGGDQFTVDNFPPGTSGESLLFHTLLKELRISDPLSRR